MSCFLRFAVGVAVAQMALGSSESDNVDVLQIAAANTNVQEIVVSREIFTITVLTMNRVESLRRLLASLENAEYDNDRVHLVIRVDHATKNGAVVALAKSFDFSHGEKTVHVATSNNGLRQSWFDAWHPATDESRGIILEDDVEVSPKWYAWLKAAWNTYGDRDDLAGISLQRQTLVPKNPSKQMEIVNEHVPFLYALVGSIGFSPHPKQWTAFLHWVATADLDHVSTPGLVTSDWYAQLDKRHMWTQAFIYFCKSHDLYTLYTNLPHKKTLGAHHREKGEHYGKTEGPDFALVQGVALDFPTELVKYGWDGEGITKSVSRSMGYPLSTQVEDGTKNVDALQVSDNTTKPLDAASASVSKLAKLAAQAASRRRSSSEDHCACMSSWEYTLDNVTYEGCAETPDWKKATWCYVVGGSDCKDAQDSTLDTELKGEDRKWVECEASAAAPSCRRRSCSSSSSSSSSSKSEDPCACMDSWEYKLDNITYEGCAETPDWEKATWCYVVGGSDCKEAQDSTLDAELSGEGRKWLECEADGEDANKAKSAAARAAAAMTVTMIVLLSFSA